MDTPPPLPNKRRATHWRLGIVLTCVIILVGTAPYWALPLAARYYGTPWPERIPDIQLEPTRPILTVDDLTEDNAFFYINQMSSLEARQESEALSREFTRFRKEGCQDNDYPSIEDWINTNRTNLNLAYLAASIPRSQIVTAQDVADRIDYITPLRRTSDALLYQAEKAAAASDWNAMLRHYRTALVINDHVMRGSAILAAMVGYSDTQTACLSIRRTAARYSFPDRVMGELHDLLFALALQREPMAEVMRHEYLVMRNAIEDHIRKPWDEKVGEIPGMLRWLGERQPRTRVRMYVTGNPESVAAHADAFYSQLIAAMSGPYNPEPLANLMSQLDVDQYSRLRLMLGGDVIGRILLGLLIPANESVYQRAWVDLATLEATRLHLAIRQYQRDHNGMPPENLQEVDAYIPAVPVDPFSRGSAPFRYIKRGTNWVVYSVGPNQTDDRGDEDYLNKDDAFWHSQDPDVVFLP